GCDGPRLRLAFHHRRPWRRARRGRGRVQERVRQSARHGRCGGSSVRLPFGRGRRVEVVSRGGGTRHTKRPFVINGRAPAPVSVWSPWASSEQPRLITPKRGTTQLLTPSQSQFRTTSDTPRRSCLAHEAQEVSKPSGRTLSAFRARCVN